MKEGIPAGIRNNTSNWYLVYFNVQYVPNGKTKYFNIDVIFYLGANWNKTRSKCL